MLYILILSAAHLVDVLHDSTWSEMHGMKLKMVKHDFLIKFEEYKSIIISTN